MWGSISPVETQLCRRNQQQHGRGEKEGGRETEREREAEAETLGRSSPECDARGSKRPSSQALQAQSLLVSLLPLSRYVPLPQGPHFLGSHLSLGIQYPETERT